MKQDTQLNYKGDRRLTPNQEAFLKGLVELCAKHRVLVSIVDDGIEFQELDEFNVSRPCFLDRVRGVQYHGDCVYDFGLMGFLTCSRSLTNEVEVVAFGDYQVPAPKY